MVALVVKMAVKGKGRLWLRRYGNDEVHVLKEGCCCVTRARMVLVVVEDDGGGGGGGAELGLGFLPLVFSVKATAPPLSALT
ncbi:hypothetical protein QVD17_09611 [Tagetes erecta]|uniref:Uncharacterized protein n=1 Tax=Tagetes erecta TaxID=13708 RepID=A0AAD8L460_TARER|nr:hypothetical protein QVD17_09611 [Tagetes erecta]